MAQPRTPFALLTVAITGTSIAVYAAAPPLATVTATTPGNQDAFGASTAIGDGFLVIGSPLDDDAFTNGGSVTVFWPGPDGFPSYSVLAYPGTLNANANFGTVVAASGDSFAVAAPANDFGSSNPVGAVYVYTVDSVSVSLEAMIQPSTLMVSDLFAHDLDLEGETLVVGAPGANGGEGSVWVFERTSGDWSSGTENFSVHGDEGDAFGWSVALDQNDASRLLVGAPWDSDDAVDSGRVYLLEDTGPGWVATAEFDQSDIGSPTSQFGHELDFDGDHFAVGEPLSALIHVIGWDPGLGTWGLVQSLSPDSAYTTSLFGESFALDGELLAAGVRLSDLNGLLSGAGYLFGLVADGTWNQLAELEDDNGGIAYALGQSVAMDGSVLIMGSPGATADAVMQAGIALGWGVDSTPGCPADVDMTGAVDADDVAEVVAGWGTCTAPDGCATDLDDDGETGVSDLLAILTSWGSCF